MLRNALLGFALATFALAAPVAQAQKKYDPGASDTEIKIGQTMPYSGPASAYGTIGKVEAAYFKMLNDSGGVNKRKLNLITVDDGYSPPKTVEMTRRLVEQDEVLFMFQQLGTATNSSVQKYLNAKKVPHLLLATGASKWNEPRQFPWTMGWNPSYYTEAYIYGQQILKTKPDAKIAVLYQNDDYGKDYLKGFKDGLGAKVNLIVAEASYEVSDPTIDSQIVTLKGSGANVFFNITTPKFAAQAIRKVYDIGWKPVHYLNNVSASVGSVLTPAGLEKAVDVISAAYIKDPTDPRWADDAGIKDFYVFMKKYAPDADTRDASNAYAYTAAQVMAQILKQCGDNLTRENVMKQAASLKDFVPPLLLPGIKLNTGPNDFAPVESMQMMRFDGKEWVLFGEVIGK